MNKKPSQFFQIISLAKGYYFRIALVAIIILVSSLVSQITPQINRALIDLISTHQPATFFHFQLTLYHLLFFWLLIFLINATLNRLSSSLTNRFVNRLQFQLRYRAYQQLFQLSIPYHNSHQSGKLLSQINRGTSQLTSFLSNLGSYFAPNLITALISIIIVSFYSPLISITVVLSFVPYFFFRFKRQKFLIQNSKRLHKLFDKEYGRVYQAVASIRLVKSFANESFELKRFYKSGHKIISRQDQNDRIRNQYVFTELYIEAVLWAIFAYIFYLGFIGQITIGTVVLLMSYTRMIRQPLWNLDWVYWQLQDAQVAAEKYLKILNSTQYPDLNPHPQTLSSLKGKIDFQHVWFKYPEKSGQDVFHNLSFSIHPGQTVALVGKSGVGKTTIANLLVRFFDPDRGSILIDDTNIKDLDLQFLRKNIGLVMQQSDLFDESIIKNLRYAKPDATLKEIKAACVAANAHEFIKSLPKGYQTIIGERGVKLSGGQRQRLSIARTLLKNPPILILDEATSSLDSHSERLVQQALDRLISDRTTIIIAHRLSTIRKADQILVLDKKTLAEQGTHAQLLKQNGIYAQLHHLQTSDPSKLKSWQLS